MDAFYECYTSLLSLSLSLSLSTLRFPRMNVLYANMLPRVLHFSVLLSSVHSLNLSTEKLFTSWLSIACPLVPLVELTIKHIRHFLLEYSCVILANVM